MGKVTGFLEYERLEEGYEPVARRVKNYKEFVVALNAEQSKTQAARCMDCGTPFCNSGCPVNNIIPDFNDLVFRGEWRDAIEVLHSTNNFPEFTGPHLPGALRSRVHAQRQRRRGRHQVDRARDHRSRLGRRLGQATAAHGQDRQDASPWSAPGRPGWRLHSSSLAPATRSRCSRRTAASVGCCATASPTSSWRSRTSIAVSNRCRPRA